MFIPEVWADGEKLFVQVNPEEAKEYLIDPHSIILGIGTIKRIRQKEHTVYVQGEQGNVIVAHLHSAKIMTALSPYSVDVPDWMKAEFEKFIKAEE